MPHEAQDSPDPLCWLAYARSDLALARTEAGPEVFLSSLCFHAQQAAEKSVKAVLLHRGTPFPRTHSLRRLLALLPADCPRPADEAEVASLTEFAVEARYPMDLEPVTDEEYRRAVAVAAAVLEWAERLIERQE